MENKSSSLKNSLIGQIALASLCRLFLNTARRFAYPFAPELSRGLEVSREAFSPIIAINHLTSLLSPAFGPLSGRWGYRTMLLCGMALMGIGMIFGGTWPWYGCILVAQFMAGLGKSIFDPALQAFVSQKVPFQKRGLAIGLMEIVWALSTLLGIPCVGLLMARFNWRAPYFFLGALGLLMLFILWKKFPDDKEQSAGKELLPALAQSWRNLVSVRPVWAMLLFGFFMSMASDNLFVVYGFWFEEAFSLKVAALGFSAMVIGGSELLGELLTARFSDRLGLRRAIFLGLFATSVFYFLLPYVATSLFAAMVMIFLITLVFEFSIVTAMAFSTEVLPGDRAFMMASFLASSSAGRICGIFLGGSLWTFGGIKIIGLVSAFCCIPAFLSLWLGLRRFKA